MIDKEIVLKFRFKKVDDEYEYTINNKIDF
jgi:hypothetical protein